MGLPPGDGHTVVLMKLLLISVADELRLRLHVESQDIWHHSRCQATSCLRTILEATCILMENVLLIRSRKLQCKNENGCQWAGRNPWNWNFEVETLNNWSPKINEF